MGKWAAASWMKIDAAFKQLRAAHPEMSIALIMHKISMEHYPFAQRTDLPYQAWMKTLRRYRRYAESKVGK